MRLHPIKLSVPRFNGLQREWLAFKTNFLKTKPPVIPRLLTTNNDRVSEGI